MHRYFFLLLVLTFSTNLSAENMSPSFINVRSSDGTNLNVVRFGNNNGPNILFIHGFSQSYLSWNKQYTSDLANNFSLVTFDLRGHGSSEKPINPKAYQSPELWANDVSNIINALDLKKPILVGWSWAGFIIMNYIRYYGIDNISGINLVGANTSLLGPIPPPPSLPGENKMWMQQLISNNIEDNLSGVKYFVDLMVAKKLSNPDRENNIILNMLTPPYVRKAMLGYPKDNSDLIEKISVPVLISHGTNDRIVNYPDVVKVANALTNSELSTYIDTGHAPFMESPKRFNKELSSFVHKHSK